jgi:hypothetical protein
MASCGTGKRRYLLSFIAITMPLAALVGAILQRVIAAARGGEKTIFCALLPVENYF